MTIYSMKSPSRPHQDWEQGDSSMSTDVRSSLGEASMGGYGLFAADAKAAVLWAGVQGSLEWMQMATEIWQGNRV